MANGGGTARHQVNTVGQAADFALTASGTGCTITHVQGADTGSINFGAASTTCNIIATAYADDNVETNETVRVTITGPAGSIPNPTNQVGTFNNDDNPWVSIDVAGLTSVAPAPNVGAQYAEEGDPGAGTNLTYTVTRGLCAAAVPGDAFTNCPGGDQTAFGLPRMSATRLADLRPTADTRQRISDAPDESFDGASLASEVTGTIVVDPINDTVVEVDETLVITITNTIAGAYNVDTTPVAGVPSEAANIATGYINDDDEEVSLNPVTPVDDTRKCWPGLNGLPVRS